MAEAAVISRRNPNLWVRVEAAGSQRPSSTGGSSSSAKSEQGHRSLTKQTLPSPLRSYSPGHPHACLPDF